MAKSKVNNKKQKAKIVKKQASEKKGMVKQKPVITGSKSGQILRGRVVSAKVPASVTVIIERRKMHPLYGKSFIRSKKYLVHDPFGVLEGDIVDIAPTRPISRNKHFIILKVVGRDIEVVATQQLREGVEEVMAQVMPEEKEEDMVLSTGSGAEGVEIVEKKNRKRKSKKEELAPKP